MKKRRLLALLLIPMLLLSACGKNNDQPQSVVEYGDLEGQQGIKVDSSEEDTENDKDNNSEARLPTYDPTSAAQPIEYTSDRKIEIKSSYYKDQLSSRTKRAFDAVYSAINNWVSTVEFESSQLITPAELEKVMHIVFLDCPEIWQADTTYSYSTNSDGYVNIVYLNYITNKEKYDETMEKVAKQKPEILMLVKQNDYFAATQVIKNCINQYQYRNVQLNADGSYDIKCNIPFETGMDRIVSQHKNSIGFSRLITYWLRECGIDCTIAIGELVSEYLENDEYEITTDYIKPKEILSADGLTTIKYNYSYYWAWNIVKIDDKWYNVDATYSNLMSLKAKTRQNPENFIYFVPDLVMSQTRLSYMNEEMLGMMPSCIDNNYQTLYRSGKYILPLTETQTVKKLQEIIADISNQDLREITLLFENEETFNYFLNHLDEQMENYNKTNGNPIGIYNVDELRDSLMISIYDIVNNF